MCQHCGAHVREYGQNVKAVHLQMLQMHRWINQSAACAADSAEVLSVHVHATKISGHGIESIAPETGSPSGPVYLKTRPLISTEYSHVGRAVVSTAHLACVAPTCLGRTSFFLSSRAFCALSAPSRENRDPADGKAMFRWQSWPLPLGFETVTGTGIVRLRAYVQKYTSWQR